MSTEIQTLTASTTEASPPSRRERRAQARAYIGQLAGESFPNSDRLYVITSYSIHYTKLYDRRSGRLPVTYRRSELGKLSPASWPM